MDILQFLEQRVIQVSDKCIYGAPLNTWAYRADPTFKFPDFERKLGDWPKSLIDRDELLTHRYSDLLKMLEALSIKRKWPRNDLGHIRMLSADIYARRFWPFFELMLYFAAQRSPDIEVRRRARQRLEQASSGLRLMFLGRAIHGFATTMYLMAFALSNKTKLEIAPVWYSEEEAATWVTGQLDPFANFLRQTYEIAHHKGEGIRMNWLPDPADGGKPPSYFLASSFDWPRLTDRVGLSMRACLRSAQANLRAMSSLKLVADDLAAIFSDKHRPNDGVGEVSPLVSIAVQKGAAMAVARIPDWQQPTEAKIKARGRSRKRFLDTEQWNAAQTSARYDIVREEAGYGRITVQIDQTKLPEELLEFRAYIVLEPGPRQTTVQCELVDDEAVGDGTLRLTLEFSDRGEIAKCTRLRGYEGDSLGIHALEGTAEIQLRIEVSGF